MADDYLPDMDKQDVKVVGLATGLGCSVVASLVVFIAGGLLLDKWLDTSPVFTLIGVAIGLVGAGYQLWELVLVSDKHRQPGPIGKKMSQRMQDRRVGETRNDHQE